MQIELSSKQKQIDITAKISVLILFEFIERFLCFDWHGRVDTRHFESVIVYS